MSGTDAHAMWQEASLWCATWRAAEHLAITTLGPDLTELEGSGVITGWWFIRKAEHWKVRYLPAPDLAEQAVSAMADTLTDLASRALVARWASTLYEPEIDAFGGTDGMAAAHELFRADSRHVLDHLKHRGNGHQRELGLLLVTSMMRAAGLDWYEQGHVWRLVAEERTVPADGPTQAEAEAVHRFLTVDVVGARTALNADSGWFTAFEQAGQQYAALSEQGTLTRGLRSVLAHHILFAWNRLGLPESIQGALATTAGLAVFDSSSVLPCGFNRASGDLGTPKVGAVTTDITATSPLNAEQLRNGLADHIRGRGTFRTSAVEQAFRTVPRELFLDGVDLAEAYKPRVVVTKRADDGSAISSASDPNLVATQAEDLNVRPGDKVLEIGAATGINAALLAELAGPDGRVVTVEIDEDLATGATRALRRAGYSQVEVVCADGADGWSADAPYERIIVTAGAWDICRSWWEQMSVGGRIVVPLRLHGSGLTRSIAFDLQPSGEMIGSHVRVCGFVPMRGTAAHQGATIRLADHVTLNVDATNEADHEALTKALIHPAHELWTGLRVGDHEPVEHLDLWLATRSETHFARLAVQAPARQSGLLSPALRWAGAAVYDGGTIAYLALRPHGPISEELGVIAHGPDSRRLAESLHGLLHEWNHTRPARPKIFAYPAWAPDRRTILGAHIERPDTRLTIEW